MLPWRELRRVMEHVILVQVVSSELLYVLEVLKQKVRRTRRRRMRCGDSDLLPLLLAP